MQEENAPYQPKNFVKVHQEHDKIFRKILEDKEEAAKFISEALNIGYDITEKEIEKYNSSFVNSMLKNKEPDIIYRLKERNVFFLIEHQTKIDYNMPLRILEYEYVIMKSAIDEKQLGKKGYKLPRVIAMLLYTGKRKWKAEESIIDVQEKMEGYRKKDFARYNVIDINDFTEEELLKDKSFLAKAMLIEKTKDTEKLVEYLEKTIEEINRDKTTYKEEQRGLLSTVIDMILSKKIGKETAASMIEKLKGGDKEMLAVLEMIDEENRRLVAKGRKEGREEIRRETAQKMLEENADIDFISRVTGLTEKEIEKLK